MIVKHGFLNQIQLTIKQMTLLNKIVEEHENSPIGLSFYSVFKTIVKSAKLK